MLVVLRLQGSAISFDSYLELGSFDAAIWNKGDLGVAGRVRAANGANIVLSQEPEALDTAFARLSSLQDLVVRTIALGGSATVDVALMVAATKASSLSLSPTWLQSLSAMGVTLSVSAYPTQEDEDIDRP